MGLYIGENFAKGYSKLGEALPKAPLYLENARVKKNIIGALVNGKPSCLYSFDSNIDGECFETWFSIFLKSLEKNTVIIMDNAKFHRKKVLFKIIKDFNKNNGTKHFVLFQPPYSPEVNLIENFWAKLKIEWRKCCYQSSLKA